MGATWTRTPRTPSTAGAAGSRTPKGTGSSWGNRRRRIAPRNRAGHGVAAKSRLRLELHLLEYQDGEDDHGNREADEHDHRDGGGNIGRIDGEGRNRNRVFQDGLQVMDHAEFPHVPRNIADDGLPQETDEQSHRERSADEDGDKEEQGSVGGAPEDRRDEEARQDIEVGGERALGM